MRSSREPSSSRSSASVSMDSSSDGNFTRRLPVERLAPPIGELQSGKVLRLLGLGLKARLITVGVETTRKAALSDKLSLAIVAVNASKNSIDKIVPLLMARGVEIISIESPEHLGDSVGRAATTVVGVLDIKLARGISAACR